MRALTAVVLATLLLCTGLRAENWPQWRGPFASGVSSESGLPVSWSEKENVAWTAALPGLGVSSPIVWGDRVFVTSQVGDGGLREGRHPSLVQEGDPAAAGDRPLGGRRPSVAAEKESFVVTAFDRATGRRVWEHRLDAVGDLPPVHEKRNLATSSAVTDGDGVYSWFGTGQLVALDMNGRVRWTRHLGVEYSPFDINWGHSSSPVIYKDSLILLCYHGSAAYLLSLDKQTGKVRRKVDRGRDVHSYSTPLVVETPRGAELVVNTSEGVEAYDADTGERLWHFAEQNRFPIPMPVLHDGIVYLSRGYCSGPYMAIRPGGRGDISQSHVRWRVPTGAPYVPSVVVYGGLLYMGGELGIVTCVDIAKGERVWQERIGGIFTASPVAADGKIYLLSETGETVVLKAGRTPQVLARNRLDGHFVASPAIAGGRLFLRADDHVVAIGR